VPPPGALVVGGAVDGDVGDEVAGAVVGGPAAADVRSGAGAAVVVGAGGVVVVEPGPGPDPARTALGGNDGCPSVPSMSVDPNVQASTLPGGGW
jgi:hypothetical protein